MESFEQWKSFLAEQVRRAQSVGVSQDTIENAAYHLGEFLAQRVDPRNREQRLLQEIWKVADPSEQKVLASLIVRLVQQGPVTH